MKVICNRLKQFILVILILVFVFPTFANNNLNYDSRWVQVANTWKVLNADGTFLSNQWFFDEIQKRWYRIGASYDEVVTNNSYTIDGSSFVTGLYTDKATNKSFYFDVTPSYTFGSLVNTNGYYVINNKSVYLEFNQNPLNGFPEITYGLNDLRNALLTKSEVVAPRAGFAGSDSDSDSGSSKQSSKKPRVLPKVDKTILIYLLGSDLEERGLTATRDIFEMANANIPNDMNVIVFTGGSNMTRVNRTREKIDPNDPLKDLFVINWGVNQIWKVSNGGIEALETNFGNTSMTEKVTFDSFLKYAKQYIPSNEYNMIISDHGGGSVSGFGVDSRNKNKTFFTGDSLLLSDVHEAIKSNGFKFDFFGYDACLMSMLEYAYSLSDVTNYFIGSEEIEFGSWYYSFLSLYSDKSKTTLDILKSIVDTYINMSTSNSTNTLSIVNMKDFKSDIDDSLGEFSRDLMNYILTEEDLTSFYTIRKKTAEMGIDSFSDYIDILDFKNRLNDDSNIPDEIKNDIEDLYSIIDNHVEYFKTKKEKNLDGSEKVCAFSMYLPYDKINYTDDDSDNMLMFNHCVKNVLNPDYRNMIIAMYTRQCLASELKNYVYQLDDDVVKTNLKNKIITRAKNKYKLPDDIATAMDDIIDYMSVNRLKAGDGGNYSLEKSGKANHLLFKFSDQLLSFVYNVHTTPLIYNTKGEYMVAGEAYIGHESYTDGGYNYWDIPLENHKWFTLNDEICSFYLDEDEDLNTENLNYLFSSEISGFVPARLIMNNQETNYQNIIINLEFNENSDTANIVGYTSYDISTNSFGKLQTEFADNDKIQLAYNFDYLRPSSKFYGSSVFHDASSLEFKRGDLQNQCVFQAYVIEDIYGQKYNITGNTVYSFIDESFNKTVRINIPLDWSQVDIDDTNKKISTSVDIGGHTEDIEFTVNMVKNDTEHFKKFDGMIQNFPQETLDYLLTDDIWLGAEDIKYKQSSYTTPDSYIPALNVTAKKDISGTTYLINKNYCVIYALNDQEEIVNIYLLECTQTTADSVFYINNKIINMIMMTVEPYKHEATDSNPIVMINRPIKNTLTGNNSFGTSLNNDELDLDTNIATESEIVLENETETEVETSAEDNETVDDLETEEEMIEEETTKVDSETNEEKAEPETEDESESDIGIDTETENNSETEKNNKSEPETETESKTE